MVSRLCSASCTFCCACRTSIRVLRMKFCAVVTLLAQSWAQDGSAQLVMTLTSDPDINSVDVSAGGKPLLLGGHGARADVDRHRALDAERDDPVEARTSEAGVAAEAKDDAALVFLRDAESGQKKDDKDDNDDDCCC